MTRTRQIEQALERALLSSSDVEIVRDEMGDQIVRVIDYESVRRDGGLAFGTIRLPALAAALERELS